MLYTFESIIVSSTTTVVFSLSVELSVYGKGVQVLNVHFLGTVSIRGLSLTIVCK